MALLSVSRPGRCTAWISQPCRPTIRRCCRRSPARRSAVAGGELGSARRSYGSARVRPELDDPEVTGAAAIESERIGVPLLLVAGGADAVWPQARWPGACSIGAVRHKWRRQLTTSGSPIPMPVT